MYINLMCGEQDNLLVERHLHCCSSQWCTIVCMVLLFAAEEDQLRCENWLNCTIIMA